MSDELILFNKRVIELEALVESLLGVGFDRKTVADLQTIQQKLIFLSSIVRNRGTLNTGGHFEWVDSKIVRALKIGQYICLEHVNLCSSAILDRLNSVFEPDGKLLLSEKGVESNNQSESVSKHSDFRAFLTLDPRNGEISRAMRNRCIELSLTADTYTRDDLKELIYLNGIHEMHLIEWALNIHYRVQQVSEFHAFNVSHLTKFAFLINENLRLGSNEAKALMDSALVVYVRSSHIDLLGMGLSYYHEKLTEEIRDEISKIPDKCLNLLHLSNVIIKADDLNSLTLIRLQCEPLIITIQCLTAEIEREKIQKVFNAARERFSNLQIDMDWKSAEYLLQMVYEMSSLENLTASEHYVDVKMQQILATANERHRDQLKNLIDLNHNLAQAIRSETSFNRNATKQQSSVPWNQHMFPRLRDYFDETPLLPRTDQLKLSAILLANLLFARIEGDTTKVKQSQINAITYSKAVNAGTIPNGLNIDLITYLYPLLDAIKTFTIEIIRHSDAITYQQYGVLICSYLWANRMYEESRNRLFKQKTVEQSFIDKLALHFNWVVKYLLNPLNDLKCAAQSKELILFRKIVQKITDCNTIRRHPLNELRKLFTKRLTEFMPFYEKNQIVLHECQTEFTKQLQLPVKKWQSFESAEYLQSLINKYRIILSDESSSFKSYLVDNVNADELQWLTENDDETATSMDDEKILAKFDQLSKSTAKFWGLDASISEADLSEQNEKFVKYLESNDGNANQRNLAPLKLIVSILPIMEYFALRAFNSVLRRNAHVHRPNVDFYKNVRSLDVSVLNSARMATMKQYAMAESMWTWILQKINSKSDGIDGVFEVMPQSIYRKIASLVKMLDSRIIGFGYNSLALNHQYLLIANDNPKQQPTIPLNSCALTISAFLSIYNEFGKSKSIGLGNLEVWSSTLTSLSKLLWNNVEMFQNRFQFEQTNIEYSDRYGRKLLAEIKYIQGLTETNADGAKSSPVEGEFLKVLQLLENKIESVKTLGDSSQARFRHFYTSAVIQSLAAVLELHLITFTPLVDPVEKSRLKKMYTQESLEHVMRLTSAYDFMKVIMSYDGLGKQIIEESIRGKTTEFKVLIEKYSEKCALRPEVCVYAELVDQINFFLQNGCTPKSQLQLITDIDAAFERLNTGNGVTQQDLQNVDEIIKRIDWCTNTAESFERSTIVRFGTYYRDFTAPLESSVIMLKNALRCLKQCLNKLRELILNSKSGNNLIGLNGNETLSSVLINLIEFPSVDRKPHLMPATVRILDNLENKDFVHSM